MEMLSDAPNLGPVLKGPLVNLKNEVWDSATSTPGALVSDPPWCPVIDSRPPHWLSSKLKSMTAGPPLAVL